MHWNTIWSRIPDQGITTDFTVCDTAASYGSGSEKSYHADLLFEKLENNQVATQRSQRFYRIVC